MGWFCVSTLPSGQNTWMANRLGSIGLLGASKIKNAMASKDTKPTDGNHMITVWLTIYIVWDFPYS